MDIEFVDKKLLSLLEDVSIDWLPISVIKSSRRKLTILACAKNEKDLRNWKSLHYEKLLGDRKGQRSIRVNDKYRIVFELDKSCDPQKVTIFSIEDYHR